MRPLDLTTSLQGTQREKNMPQNTTGMQSAKARLWKTLQNKWPVSSTNKLQG